MYLGDGIGHLTYSTLVHPGDNWAQMWDSVQKYLPAVKANVSPDRPFGVCLRLAAQSVKDLQANPQARKDLAAFFRDNDMYLYTANAFVYGGFKNQMVKEEVYEPDWRGEDRTSYTMGVADILAEIAPGSVNPSIQSPPLGFKPRVTGPDVVDAYTRNVLRTVAHCHELEKRTGRTVTLALEPEPYCFLETTPEVLAYFRDHAYADKSVTALAKMLGKPEGDAEAVLHKHLGIVYDICHQAVEFEDITSSLQSLVDAGIPILKLQEAAAIWMPEVTQDIVDVLRNRFAKSIYLTQTMQKKDGKLTKFLNLEDAFKAWEEDPGPREWRTHFHVPVFLDDLGDFRTTRFAIEEALAFHKANPCSEQLEIETYTWDVLPDHLKTGDIVEYVTRELEWVRDQVR